MNGHDFTREQNMEARMTLAPAAGSPPPSTTRRTG